MTKIIFLTSGAVEYKLLGHSLFESICLTARGKIFPSLKPRTKIEIAKFAKVLQDKKIDFIITASTVQAKETADLLGKILKKPVGEDKNLFPLRFNPKKMMTEQEFKSLDGEAFNVLRAKFLENFFKDNLIDANKEVKVRFEKLKKKFQGKTVLAVSHAFLIKLFSVYSEIGEEMFENRNKLFELFNPSKVPYERLSGIEINV